MGLLLTEFVFLPRPREIRPRAGTVPAHQPVTRAIVSAGLPPQGYRIAIGSAGIHAAGADPAGLFYAAATLNQILEQCPSEIPAGEIRDWPDFPVRGVMLDISRSKVPTMGTLFSLVDVLAGMKVNHLQLYTEHTFAYSGHRDVWADSSPMTAEQVRLLDGYCRERFIELVPNQNSFGHLQKWLTLPRYRDLAECLDGFEWPWGGRSEEPFSLDPSNPGSLALLEGLFDELLPNFQSSLFNVGCDETFDLGQGKNRELCERAGKGQVYLDFLLKIHQRVTARGHTMLYWGDIIMEHPELVPRLPPGAIALEWGYEADHPFEEHGAKFAESGVHWWVCPGTSSWNSLAGRTENCLGNLRAAARSGLSHGARGFLNTDWGDNGHWQVLPVSYLGLAAGAALSWCRDTNGQSDFVQELDTHVFRDAARVMGGIARDLGNAYTRTGIRIHNESALFQVLRHPDRREPPAGLRAEALAETRAWIETTASRLNSARMVRPDAELVRDEYALTVRMLLLACDRASRLLEGREESDRESIQDIISEYRRVWLLRNRVGGLSDSVKRLEALLPPVR
jgi:hypothetical protein